MTYRYREIGKYLVCVDQPVSGALRNLVFGYEANKLSSLGVTPAVARNAIKVVVRAKLRSRYSNHYQPLSAFGQLGMQVHRGYKLFDFDGARVTKIFAPGVSREEADQEIAASKEAAIVSSAPRFVAADPDSTWFIEEYIKGTHATDLVSRNSSDYLRYYDDVEKCLLELLGCSVPLVIDARAHISRLADDAWRDRWLNAGFSKEETDGISDYIRQLSSELVECMAGRQLQLTRTHGDFSLVNAISTDNGLRIIDWEGIGPGSLFSDIYNFMFAERYYERSSADFSSEVQSIIEKFRDAVLKRYPALQQAATMNQSMVRRLYYLERIRLMANRDATPVLYRVIRKSIAMFTEFDHDAGDFSPY